MENTVYNNNLKFIVSLTATLTVGALGGFFTFSEIPTWYASLVKPSFNPPNGLFGPVWTTLYAMMGYSFYLIWRLPSSTQQKKAMLVFGIQLLLNAGWSFVFFKCHALFGAIIEIVALWLSILYTIFLFYPLQKKAALLLIPYLLWVSFATVLTVAIWQLN